MRRAVLSCDLCRQRKVRCDRGLPCHNCVLRQSECVWSEAEATQSPVIPTAPSAASLHALQNRIDDLHAVVATLGGALGFSPEQLEGINIHRARELLRLSPLPAHESDEDADGEMDEDFEPEADERPHQPPRMHLNLPSPPLLLGEHHHTSGHTPGSSTTSGTIEEAWTPDAWITEHDIDLSEYPQLRAPMRTISKDTASMPPTPGQYDGPAFFEVQKPQMFTFERHWAS